MTVVVVAAIAAVLIAVGIAVFVAVTYGRLCERLIDRDVALGRNYKGVGRKAAMVLVEAERVLAEAGRINDDTVLVREDTKRIHGHLFDALSDHRVQHLLDHGESKFDAFHARIEELAAIVDTKSD